MKIEIETNGTCEGTEIKINGKVQDKITYFEFSIASRRKPKMSITQEVNGALTPMSFYAGDFAKFDDVKKIKTEEVGYVGTEKNSESGE